MNKNENCQSWLSNEQEIIPRSELGILADVFSLKDCVLSSETEESIFGKLIPQEFVKLKGN